MDESRVDLPPQPGTQPSGRPTPHHRPMRWLIIALAALGLGVCAIVNFGLIALDTGSTGFWVGAVLALLPVPVYVTLALWLDRFEAEPPKLLFFAFLWGALIATGFAALFNTLSGGIASLFLGESGGELFATLISAPLVEETAKSAALFIFFWWKRDEFDGVIDGIVYAAMVGLGFAMTENISYYGRTLQEGLDVTAATFIVRGVLGPYAHPLFTAMTGIGLGLARQTGNARLRILAPIGGLLLAIFLHFLWNAGGSFGLAFFVIYLLVMAPLFIGILIIAGFSLRREGQMIREQLRRDMERGRITQAEYVELSSIRGRMGASWRALTTQGWGAWRTQRQLHQLESELAFHRWRVARGIHAADDREALYLRQLYALRQGLRPANVARVE